MNPIKTLILAVGMFSIIPMPKVGNVEQNKLGKAVLFLPAVGLFVGMLSAIPGLVFKLVGLNNSIVAASALAGWALFTGGFHLDGLADTNDGLASRKSSEEALDIMKKHDIGPMGVATIVLVLLVDFAALSADTGYKFLVLVLAALAPMVGRGAGLLGTAKWVKPARAGGLGAVFIGQTTITGLVCGGLATLALAFVAGWLVASLSVGLMLMVAAVLAWLVAWCWQLRLERKVFGMTGDTLGSMIEFCQLSFLVAAVTLVSLVS